MQTDQFHADLLVRRIPVEQLENRRINRFVKALDHRNRLDDERFIVRRERRIDEPEHNIGVGKRLERTDRRRFDRFVVRSERCHEHALRFEILLIAKRGNERRFAFGGNFIERRDKRLANAVTLNERRSTQGRVERNRVLSQQPFGG